MVEDSREGIVVRRQHRDRRALSLHSTQVGYPNFFFCHCDAHHSLKVKMRSRRNRQPRIRLRASRRALKSRLGSRSTLRSRHEPKLCCFEASSRPSTSYTSRRESHLGGGEILLALNRLDSKAQN